MGCVSGRVERDTGADDSAEQQEGARQRGGPECQAPYWSADWEREAPVAPPSQTAAVATVSSPPIRAAATDSSAENRHRSTPKPSRLAAVYSANATAKSSSAIRFLLSGPVPFASPANGKQQTVQKSLGRRRATWDVRIDRQQPVQRTIGQTAVFEAPAADGAGARRNHQLGRWHGRVSLQKGPGHAVSHDAGHEQNVGVTRRGSEEDPQPLEIHIGELNICSSDSHPLHEPASTWRMCRE